MSQSSHHDLLSSPNVQDLLEVWNARSKPIIIWAGSGLSAPAKLPTWEGLRKTLTDEASNNAAILSEPDKTSHLQKIAAIKAVQSHWKAFEMLEELAATTFQATIRRALVNTIRCEIPSAYTMLWDLNIQGMLTLNIDGFASRAFSASRIKSPRLFERNGFNIRTLVGTLTNIDARLIANLHGSADDPDSWVFTEKKLNRLLSDQKYEEFVGDCIKYSTIVLLGVSAQDKAVVSHFQRITRDYKNSGPHFWITDASNYNAVSSVEAAGIRTILYQNEDETHSFIPELLEAVRKYKPKADEAPPIHQLANETALNHIPPAKDLISKTPNEIRVMLNNEAARILEPETEEAYQKFETFCKEYSRPIHSASFVSDDPTEEANAIGEYRASYYVKEGGFAKVWNGLSTNGDPVAIKVFRHEIREQPELLKAFRRGVRSMRYLRDSGVPGVVEFLDASEVPPVVIMEWIDGITLWEAVKQGATKSWWQRIRIAYELSKIIFAVHNTPQRIVHRDLRPHNVMLRDYYAETDHAEVVVLDFDLSWHLNALEKSVYVSGGTAYLAPEQLQEIQGVSTRSAVVDSFGFGMMLYYMISGTDPAFFSHNSPTWPQKVFTSCIGTRCKEWISLPKRVARLILAATQHDQNQRLTFGQIMSETTKLWETIQDSKNLNDMSMITEECFARVELFSNYEQTPKGSFCYQSPSGVKFEIEPHPSGGIYLSFSFLQAGHEQYQVLSKIGEAFTQIPQKFSRHFETYPGPNNLAHGQCNTSLTIVPREYTNDMISKISFTLQEVATGLINIASY